MPIVNNGKVLSTQYVGGKQVTATMVDVQPTNAEFVIAEGAASLAGFPKDGKMHTVLVPASWKAPIKIFQALSDERYDFGTVAFISGCIYQIGDTNENRDTNTIQDSAGHSVRI